MIRPTIPEDTPTLIALTDGTGMFKPLEIQALQEVLDDYFAETQRDGHKSITVEQGGAIVGFAYYAPAPMTDGTWYLYWIVVGKGKQGQGLGAKMVEHVEADLCRTRRARVLFVETGSLPHYERNAASSTATWVTNNTPCSRIFTPPATVWSCSARRCDVSRSKLLSGLATFGYTCPTRIQSQAEIAVAFYASCPHCKLPNLVEESARELNMAVHCMRQDISPLEADSATDVDLAADPAGPAASIAHGSKGLGPGHLG